MRPRNANFNAASIQSSPSHQPISLLLPPGLSGASYKHRYQLKLRSYDRKPPPCITSTRLRETNPELSSSGEGTSTAAKERPRSASVGRVATASLPPTIITNVNANDNDECNHYEDLIKLEYHPSGRNISKRRRSGKLAGRTLSKLYFMSPRTPPFKLRALTLLYSVPSTGSPNRRDHDFSSLPAAYDEDAHPPILVHSKTTTDSELNWHVPNPLRLFACGRSATCHPPR